MTWYLNISQKLLSSVDSIYFKQNCYVGIKVSEILQESLTFSQKIVFFNRWYSVKSILKNAIFSSFFQRAAL